LKLTHVQELLDYPASSGSKATSNSLSLGPHSMLLYAGWGKIPDVINLFLNIEGVEHIANAVQAKKQIFLLNKWR